MKNILTFFALFTFFSACNQHSHKVEELVLNDGEKWEANSETTQGIDNMKTILANFSESSSDASSREDLKKALETEFGNIFKQCTMTGEAHDQLHHFLFPMKELFNKIASDKETEGKEAIKHLKKHLDIYGNYFK